MKANIILINILLSKVAYLAILFPHRKLLVNRVDSKQKHKSEDRNLALSSSMKAGLSAIFGLIVGFYLISYLLKNYGGIKFKEKLLAKLEKEDRLKTRHLILRTYSTVSKVLDKSGIRNNSFERILKNKKIWKKFLSNKQLMKKTMRIGNIEYVNLINQPLKVKRKLVKGYKSKISHRQPFSRKLAGNDSFDASCGEHICPSIFITTFTIGAFMGFLMKWNEENMVNAQLSAKFKDSGDSKGRKLGVLSDLMKQIRSFTGLNSSKSKKSSGSNFIQNLGVKFLTGQSNKKQKKIVNIFSNIFSILPKNIKNILKRGTFR